MNRLVTTASVALALLYISVSSRADVFHLGAGLTSLDTVIVGDAGNAPDTRYGHGAVGYTYNIGKYEVTAAQYADFLNHKAQSDPYGLYNTMMDTSYGGSGCNIKRSGVGGNYTYTVPSDWANRPVDYVSFWDACRFANWLHNGQGNGDTETGAYTLNGYNGLDGRTICRNPGAKWYLPSESEWYKAAYYRSGSADAGYWNYPTQSNAVPSNQVLSTDPGNSANCGFFVGGNATYCIGYPYYRTNVGEFENSGSAYGTLDQGGNVWEWNEALIYPLPNLPHRGLRGGSYSPYEDSLNASFRGNQPPTQEFIDFGFRVASAVPEPSSVAAFVFGVVSILWTRRRRPQE